MLSFKVVLSLPISKTDLSGIATLRLVLYYRERCANRANFLDSFEGKLHSNFITSPLEDACDQSHIT